MLRDGLNLLKDKSVNHKKIPLMDEAYFNLNGNLDEKAVVCSRDQPWIPSPRRGVLRRPMYRLGGEVARATSVVRYEPGSVFDNHKHPGGEEIFVLEGVFQDEQGDYPAGTYLRNPPGSSHSPRSLDGCEIFVKLWQFCPGDSQSKSIRTDQAAWTDMGADGTMMLPLHSYGGVIVQLIRLPAVSQKFSLPFENGMEIFVIRGRIEDCSGQYGTGCWIRHPRSGRLDIHSSDGAIVYVETGRQEKPFIALPR